MIFVAWFSFTQQRIAASCNEGTPFTT